MSSTCTTFPGWTADPPTFLECYSAGIPQMDGRLGRHEGTIAAKPGVRQWWRAGKTIGTLPIGRRSLCERQYWPVRRNRDARPLRTPWQPFGDAAILNIEWALEAERTAGLRPYTLRTCHSAIGQVPTFGPPPRKSCLNQYAAIQEPASMPWRLRSLARYSVAATQLLCGLMTGRRLREKPLAV